MAQQNQQPSEAVLVHVPRRLDTEDAQLALERIQELLKKHAIVEQLVHRQEAGDDQSTLVEGLIRRSMKPN